jgi:hypothetical protein
MSVLAIEAETYPTPPISASSQERSAGREA